MKRSSAIFQALLNLVREITLVSKRHTKRNAVRLSILKRKSPSFNNAKAWRLKKKRLLFWKKSLPPSLPKRLVMTEMKSLRRQLLNRKSAFTTKVRKLTTSRGW